MGVTCTINNCVSLVFFWNSYLYNGGIGGYTKNNLSMKNMFVRKAGSAHDMSSQTFMCFEYWR